MTQVVKSSWTAGCILFLIFKSLLFLIIFLEDDETPFFGNLREKDLFYQIGGTISFIHFIPNYASRWLEICFMVHALPGRAGHSTVNCNKQLVK